MFDFNKSNRMIDGPIEFSSEVEIDRPASEVFPLIDIADARFRHAQMGAQVEPVPGSEVDFELSTEEMEDVVFRFKVLEKVAGSLLRFEAVIDPQINALVKAIEEYRVESLGDTSCKVIVTTKASFDEALSDEEVAGEAAVMSMAMTSDLEKTKVLAEDGLDAAKALEEAELGFEIDCDELDLSDLDIDWDDIQPEQ